MKVVSVVGARPQFVKAAAVSRGLRQVATLHEVLVHTGQHYDANMSSLFFSELRIPHPDYNLGIGSGSHGAQTGRMMEAIETVLLAEHPDCVLVYGDTNSTLAGALAGSKLHIPVAHVEAGLRSFNRAMPEELNRVVADHVSEVLFAPTATAVANLIREGIPAAKIELVGDVMYDTALLFADVAEQSSTVLKQLGITPKGYLLATIHRAENTDQPGRLVAILEGLGTVAASYPVVLPLHPRTRAVIQSNSTLSELASPLTVIDPVGYLDMVMLEKNAMVIATDSGGIQKEAYFHGVPCITLRGETEWVELVQMGWNRLVDPSDAKVVAKALAETLNQPLPSLSESPYGCGDAAQKITDRLKRLTL